MSPNDPCYRQSAADVDGPWIDPNFESGLIQRLRETWSIPFAELTNEQLATFIRQQIAISHTLPPGPMAP